MITVKARQEELLRKLGVRRQKQKDSGENSNDQNRLRKALNRALGIRLRV